MRKSEQEKLADEREARRQKALKAYTVDRTSESLPIVEAEVDDPVKEDPIPVKSVRTIAKCHPISGRHTIEAYKNHVKPEHVVAIQLPDKEEIVITAQTGDPDPVTNVRAKEKHTISLGAAKGTLMGVPRLRPLDSDDPLSDRGSATIDLLFAIQDHVELVNRGEIS